MSGGESDEGSLFEVFTVFLSEKYKFTKIAKTKHKDVTYLASFKLQT